jgi:hypothetical protein
MINQFPEIKGYKITKYDMTDEIKIIKSSNNSIFYEYIIIITYEVHYSNPNSDPDYIIKRVPIEYEMKNSTIETDLLLNQFTILQEYIKKLIVNKKEKY